MILTKIMENETMVRMKRGLPAALLICFAILATAPPPASSGTGLVVIYSNDVDGNVKPCG